MDFLHLSVRRNLVKQRLSGSDLFLLGKYLNCCDMPDRRHSVLHLCLPARQKCADS